MRMESIPRPSLSQRTADWLARAIADGEWVKTLPGERALCDHLQVSRPVLRDALQHLEKIGLISREPNRPRQILSHPGKPSLPPSKVIFLINSETMDETFHPVLKHTRKSLSSHGLDSEIRFHYSTKPLLKTVSSQKSDLWVLVAMSEKTQRWFFENQIRSIVAGSTFSGVDLSSLDIDHRSIGRHATGRFHGAGHRHIALIAPDRPCAGDLETEAGMADGMRMTRKADSTSRVIRCRYDPDNVRREINRALRTPNPPTAFLVCHALLALTALTSWQEKGYRTPDDISLISRDSATCLSYTQPSIAHYKHDETKYAQLLARMIMTPPPKHVSHRLIPKLVDGGSFGPPSGKSRPDGLVVPS